MAAKKKSAPRNPAGRAGKPVSLAGPSFMDLMRAVVKVKPPEKATGPEAKGKKGALVLPHDGHVMRGLLAFTSSVMLRS